MEGRRERVGAGGREREGRSWSDGWKERDGRS